MKTKDLFKFIALICLIFTFGTGFGQDVQGIVKRKVKNKTNREINRTVNEGMDVLEGKEKKKPTSPAEDQSSEDTDVVVVNNDKVLNNVPLPDFIDPGSAIFVDDFDTEKPTEFPSKWVQIDGAIQNNQVLSNGQKDGVIEMINNHPVFKPSIKGENYLGSSFKIQIQVYFYENHGNQAYYVNLKNANNVYGNHDLRIGYGTMHSGSDGISRFPGGIQPGWHTIQYSFNRGVLKGYFDGVMLINDPDISRNGVEKREFTHLEIEALSPGSSRGKGRAMITYFAIGGEGMPLYKRLITDGKLVVNDINFEVNSFVIAADSYGTLDQIVEMMDAYPEISLDVHGHTDSDGSDKFNQELSENRAKAVMNYITGKGISTSRLTSAGYGETKPMAKGNSDEAKAKNRRVEFVLNQ